MRLPSIIKLSGGLILTIFILLNIVVYQHASTFLNFTAAGQRTAPPESLTAWQKLKILLTGVSVPKPVNTSTPRQWNLSFETQHLTVNAEIELEIWFIPSPSSTPTGIVLLFHGYASSKSSLLSPAKVFHNLGYHTILVDFRGSGGSNQQTTSIGFEEAEDVTTAMEYARIKFGHLPLILYGQSMGSVAIFRAIAISQQSPTAIIVEAVFDRLLTTVKRRFSAMGVPSVPWAPLLVWWGGIQKGFYGFSHNPIDYATHITCPSLVLQGTRDPRVTVAEAHLVFQNLNTTEKEFVEFKNAGHWPLAGAPKQWRQVVARFLKTYVLKLRR